MKKGSSISFANVFNVELTCCTRSFSSSVIHSLVSSFTVQPQQSRFFPAGSIVGRFGFLQWLDALDFAVYCWDRRLHGFHSFEPILKGSFNHKLLTERLTYLFIDHINRLLQGDIVQQYQKRIATRSHEIEKVKRVCGKRVSLLTFERYQERLDKLHVEKKLIQRKLEEFQAAMHCILDHIDDRNVILHKKGSVAVFHFGKDLNWPRLHGIISRECRRLKEGLPMYAYRREILEQIYAQKVLVLTGETGSGKSTQLVQYILDSGCTPEGSVVCTQPRKISAKSLAQRVREESQGCYATNAVACYWTYSSLQDYSPDIVFTTDNCLLQHCMSDATLDGISCIIIDEAHERSLNTDLLLSLLKKLMLRKLNLRIVVMSATVDVGKFSNYFFCCNTFHVSGRNFPVEIHYLPSVNEGYLSSTDPYSVTYPSYLLNTVKIVNKIHKTEDDGAILAFLTSQSEVEWACEHFHDFNAVVLPLHGKLSCEEQDFVFHRYPGKRKVIFATNIAETSLTIPDIKYVVDCGMVKESRYDPGSGMNLLRVCEISKSSANQRAGRAGRTAPGKCYRIYSAYDFEAMACHADPEIRKVHLGIAILRILALGNKNVQDFDFVDPPDAMATEMAIKKLVQLDAVLLKDDAIQLTNTGWHLIRLGIEPALGKLILTSLHYTLGKEGIVLAAAMANASSIFCRVGSEEEKAKSDCLRVQFCHPSGDLFTLLSVYKKWEEQEPGGRNVWCWDNSINAKSMRRCKENVRELERCLQQELQVVIPSYWKWDPSRLTPRDKSLKKVILSSLVENVAMYSGYDRLGYQVALSGHHIALHPSCSLLMYGQRPEWVVFGQILSISNDYLVCVTAIDHESLLALTPEPPFDISLLESQRMIKTVFSGLGNNLLRRFCGKMNNNLHNLLQKVQELFNDDRIGIEADFDKGEIEVFTCVEDAKKVSLIMAEALGAEANWLKNECIEKHLFVGTSGRSPLALFGMGAEIKHLELETRYLSVDVYYPCVHNFLDKELLMMFEKNAPGIANFHKYCSQGHSNDGMDKWGKLTYLTPEAAERAVKRMDGIMFSGTNLKVIPVNPSAVDERIFRFPAVTAKLLWPRRRSRCKAVVRSKQEEVVPILNDCLSLMVKGRFAHCEIDRWSSNCLMISGLDSDTEEPEIWKALRTATKRTILNVRLIRGQPVDQPPISSCEEALFKLIGNFMPRNGISKVQVFKPEENDYMTRAKVSFDGSLHLEAAKALEKIEGKVLSGCQPWQTIRCERRFYSYVSCPNVIYSVIRKELDSLIEEYNLREGVECKLERTENGLHRVKVGANGTKTVADLRKPLEQLMKGTTLTHPNLTPGVTNLLFSREGICLMKAIGNDTQTYVLHDKQHLGIKVFGPPDCVSKAKVKLIKSLLHLYENKQVDICLRGGSHPPNLLKVVVQKFGPDLHALKIEVPGAEVSLNTRRHIISVRGSKDSVKKVEEEISSLSRSFSEHLELAPSGQRICAICLCGVEDSYRLEGCGHDFCRSCLVEQFDSAIRNHEGFPLCCTHTGCKKGILMVDLRALLTSDKLEELFRASLGAFVTSSGGKYRFCPSPDCPAVYETIESSSSFDLPPFSCGSCYVDTCRRCHLEYHPDISCEMYKEFKQHPDLSLTEWSKGKDNVKNCPTCGYTIEKGEGCNHVSCRCGMHICWVCLKSFFDSDECYSHLKSDHTAIYVL